MSALLEVAPLPPALEPFAGFVRACEPLARHTTMRVGGNARWWAAPNSPEELEALLQAVRRAGYPLQVVGAGSNLIASDAGFDGVVLCLGKGFDWSRVDADQLCAGAAALLPRLTHFALQHRLGNFEWACGIPGTVGASVWGNAGARGFNGTQWEGRDAAADLVRVVAFDREGKRHELARADIDFSYRRSSLDLSIVAEATFRLEPLSEAQTHEHRRAVKKLLEKRRQTQPTSAASAGCVWKNPQAPDCRGAGELIERLGLKGLRHGGAIVSTVHGNFIINQAGATGADVAALIHEVEARVMHETGIRLEREVRLIGK